ncbi:unnamed protein product [Closterium sp. NIES-54]
MAAQELRWLTYLLTDLGEQPRSPLVMYVDNKAIIALCQEHRLEHRTKHIALQYFLARELQQRGQLRLAYVATRANTADIFTKTLPPDPRVGGTGAGDPRAGEAGAGDARAGDPGAKGTGAGGAGAGGTGAGGAGAGGAGAGGTGAGDPEAGGAGAGDAGARDPGAGGTGAGGVGAGGTGAGGVGAGGAGAGGTGAGDPGAGERREPESHPASPVCAVHTGRRVPRPRPPPAPGTHIMALRPSSVPLRVPLPSPPTSSLLDVPEGSETAVTRSPWSSRLRPRVPLTSQQLHDWYGRRQRPTSAPRGSPAGGSSAGVAGPGGARTGGTGAAGAGAGAAEGTGAVGGAGAAGSAGAARGAGAAGGVGAAGGAGATGGAGAAGGAGGARAGGTAQPRLFFAPPSPSSKPPPDSALRQVLSLPSSTVSARRHLPWLADHPGQSTPHHHTDSVTHGAKVLQRFGFTWSSAQATPPDTGHSLSAPPSDESVESSGPYPELVGCLMYLMTCTRPDLAYPLGLLARYVAPGQGDVVLTGHSDASWVDDQATQRSSQGYTFSLGSGSVSWHSTRSSSFLGSSCEAEIYATAMAAQELRWLTYLLTDLGERPRSPPVLYVDNKAAIALCQEHRLEHRTKHIALRYFLARELQQRGQLRLTYVATRANTADIFTKALPSGDHQHFCTLLGLVPTLPHLL